MSISVIADIDITHLFNETVKVSAELTLLSLSVEWHRATDSCTPGNNWRETDLNEST